MVWTFQRNRQWKFKLNILEAEMLTASWQITGGSPQFSNSCYRLHQNTTPRVWQTLRQISRQIYPQSHRWLYTCEDIKEGAYGLHRGGVLKWDVCEMVYARSPFMMWKSFLLKLSREILMELWECSITISSTTRTKYLCDWFSWNLRISDGKVLMKLKLHFNFDVWFHCF